MRMVSAIVGYFFSVRRLVFVYLFWLVGHTADHKIFFSVAISYILPPFSVRMAARQLRCHLLY
jgi:hypothetical protein